MLPDIAEEVDRSIGPSQSALLTMRAGFLPRRNRGSARAVRECPRGWPANCSRTEQRSFVQFAARITDQPVPPPTRATAMSGPLQRASAMTGSSAPHVQARRRRIEPDVPGQRPGGEHLADAFGSVVKHLAPFEFRVEIHVGQRADARRNYTVTAWGTRCATARDGRSTISAALPPAPAR